jgi:hypothetical protein
MPTDKSPEEVLAETRAKQAISQKYLDPDDNPDLEPERQDQLDMNRIPGNYDGNGASDPHDDDDDEEE